MIEGQGDGSRHPSGRRRQRPGAGGLYRRRVQEAGGHRSAGPKPAGVAAAQGSGSRRPRSSCPVCWRPRSTCPSSPPTPACRAPADRPSAQQVRAIERDPDGAAAQPIRGSARRRQAVNQRHRRGGAGGRCDPHAHGAGLRAQPDRRQGAAQGCNPDEVVAVGAALPGGVLGGEVTDILLLDVTPLTLGWRRWAVWRRRFSARNTTLPPAAARIFSTADDNQTAVTIHVLRRADPWQPTTSAWASSIWKASRRPAAACADRGDPSTSTPTAS